MRHIAVKVYCTVREKSIQHKTHKSTFGASRIISYQEAARIPLSHDGSSVCFETCYLRFAAPVSSSMESTRCTSNKESFPSSTSRGGNHRSMLKTEYVTFTFKT